MKPDILDRLRRNGASFLIFSVSLVLFYILYRLRFLDDSRLTSWDDVFSVVQPLRTGVLLCISLVAAFIFSRSALIERKPVAVLFIISFAVSAMFWQEPEMIVDASRYFIQAKHLELYGVSYFFREWGNGINAWTDLPAIPFLYGSLFTVFGESRLIIQVFNTLLFSSSVVITYLIGRELWDKDTGLYAAMFLLGIPYLFTQLPLMLVDLPSMFFLMLSIYTFLLALRRGGTLIALASLSIFIAFFTKYSAWLMLTVIPVMYAVELYKNRKKGLDRYALRGMIVFFVSFFMISIVIAFKHDEIVKQIYLLISYQMPGLHRWGESFYSTYLFQMHPVIPALVAVSLFVAVRKRDTSYISVGWLVFIILALQVMRIRYIIMVFPLLSLMAAYGLGAIRDKMISRFIVYSTVAFSLTLALSGFLPFLQHMSAVNLRDAGKYLDSLDVAVVEVFTPLPDDFVMSPAVSVPLLDLHTKKKIVY
ncbi:MAG: glycosyltransferase family 39 protein, partial [Nitrospirota bacterium]|nr:glycosyltransferase family 39 protein [Nitrospirota bacterium]